MPSDTSGPLVLGLDTSGGWCGAALIDVDICPAAAYENMARGQAERLFPMIEEVLEAAGATWSDIGRIGVGIGPGNFTGIRISVSAARGLSLSLGVPAIGVSLLDALAHGTDGPILACIDARRDEAYFQRYGFGDPAPFLSPIATLPDERVADLKCIGNAAAGATDRLGAQHAPAAFAPASAIARLAALADPAKAQRPAPLYIRAPDAAPPRDPAPTLLP